MQMMRQAFAAIKTEAPPGGRGEGEEGRGVPRPQRVSDQNMFPRQMCLQESERDRRDAHCTALSWELR